MEKINKDNLTLEHIKEIISHTHFKSLEVLREEGKNIGVIRITFKTSYPCLSQIVGYGDRNYYDTPFEGTVAESETIQVDILLN